MRNWQNRLTWFKQLFQKAYPFLITARALYFQWIWIVILGYGFYLIWMHTPNGIGINHDTMNYFSAAENFINGNGLYINFYGEWKPMTIYQPLYSVVLGLLSLGIFSFEETALMLNAVLMGLNAVLVFHLTARATGYAFPAATLSSLAFLFSQFTAYTHLIGWTEPLFICLMLSGFLWLDRYFAVPDHAWFNRHLSTAGLFIALALLTRYAGLVLVPVMAFVILITSQNRLINRVKAAGMFVLPILLLVGGWLFRNYLLTGNPARRSIAFTQFSGELWQQFQNTIISFYFGNWDGAHWFWLSVGITAMLLLVAILPYFKRPLTRRIQGTVGLFALSYIIFLLVIPFLGNATPLDHRLLLPFFVALSISGLAGVFNLIQKSSYKSILYILVIGLAFPWLSELKGYGDYFRQVSTDTGLGFNSTYWEHQPNLTYTQNLPKQTLIFAQAPHNMYANYLTGRTIYPLRSLSELLTDKSKKDFGYVLFLDPCCEDGETPELPSEIRINKTVIDQKLYRVQLKE